MPIHVLYAIVLGQQKKIVTQNLSCENVRMLCADSEAPDSPRIRAVRSDSYIIRFSVSYGLISVSADNEALGSDCMDIQADFGLQCLDIYVAYLFVGPFRMTRHF